MSAASAADTMTHLPALAAAVGKKCDSPKHSEYTRKRQGWQRRLVDEYESTRRVAELNLLRQALEQGDGEALRRVAVGGVVHRNERRADSKADSGRCPFPFS